MKEGNGMGKETVMPQEESALERYRIISPILAAMETNTDKGKIGLLKSEACALAGISRKTLWRWLTRYAQNGFEGLKYQSASGEKKRLIPGELVKEAVLLRLEVPSRSIPQIIEILEMEGKAPVGFLKRSTLQDRLREEGYASAQMKLYQKPGVASRRFARAERVNPLRRVREKRAPGTFANPPLAGGHQIRAVHQDWLEAGANLSRGIY